MKRALKAFVLALLLLAPAAHPVLATPAAWQQELEGSEPAALPAGSDTAVARGVGPPPLTPVLLMPDSINNGLVVFDPMDGAVLFAPLFGLAGGTPIHAITVGDEIWVSEQVGDRISRWSWQGDFLGAIGANGGLDNIRGMALLDGYVLVTNAGTANAAPGPALVLIGLDGTLLGHQPVATTSPSPFALLPRAQDLLVSSAQAGDDIHRYDAMLSSLGTFHDSGSLNFAQQMARGALGLVLVAGFSSNNVVMLDPSSGAVMAAFPAPGARGVAQLTNGNILWTNNSGAHVYDPLTQTSTLVYAGGGRHLSRVLTPPADLIFRDGFEGI